MDAQKSSVFIIAILIGLSLFSALALEIRLAHWAWLEMIILVVSMFFFLWVLFGLWLEERWAHSLCTILFSLEIANLLWLFLSTKTLFVFLFGILVNVAGLVLCLSLMEPEEWVIDPEPVNLETYDLAGVKTEFEAFKKRRVQKKSK